MPLLLNLSVIQSPLFQDATDHGFASGTLLTGTLPSGEPVRARFWPLGKRDRITVAVNGCHVYEGDVTPEDEKALDALKVQEQANFAKRWKTTNPVATFAARHSGLLTGEERIPPCPNCGGTSGHREGCSTPAYPA